MSLKQEIEAWVTALAYYDNNEFERALGCFEVIADTSKILFNCGVIHATLGEHGRAVDFYQRAVRLDQYLAVSYFQQGVSNFLMGDFEEALANFNDTLLYLRGNNNIDYDQLGLKFKLYSCEVLFNRGLCYIYLQQKQIGLTDLSFAAKEKVIPDHDVIDEAINEQAEGYTVFSIPVGVVYRPNEAKVRNLRSRDYMGKARLVAAADRNYQGRKHMSADTWARDDRPPENISFAATNLVKPGLSSRSRQQSEPPIQRNLFPPTPPPEADKQVLHPGTIYIAGDSTPTAKPKRSASLHKPERLELGVAAFERPQPAEKLRLGTVRSASERPRPTRTRTDGSICEYRPTSGAIFRGEIDPPPHFYHEITTSPLEPRLEVRREQSSRSHEHGPILPHPRSSNDTNRSAKSMFRPQSIEEESPEVLEDTRRPQSTFSSPTLEVLPATSYIQPQPRRQSPPRDLHRYGTVGKIRLKLRVDDDTRYIIVTPSVKFEELVEQVRQKLALKDKVFKIKFKDDGDMVTMGDQEDWDMAIEGVMKEAKRVGQDLGKLDVWVQAL